MRVRIGRAKAVLAFAVPDPPAGGAAVALVCTMLVFPPCAGASEISSESISTPRPGVEPTAAGKGAPRTSAGRRLSLTFTHALAVGGPASSLEAAMLREGLGDNSTQCPFLDWSCHDPTLVVNPHSDRLGTPWTTVSLRARYQLTPRVGLGASLCYSPLQTTTGYRASDTYLLYVESRATTLSALVSVGNGDSAWAGAGPSLNFVTLAGDPHGHSNAFALGGVAEVGYRHPKASRVYLEAVGQYRYVAPVRMKTPFFDQAYEIGFSHWAVMAGIGVRLGRAGEP